MRVDASHRTWQVSNVSNLQDVLAWRDKRGGAQFWLSDDLKEYPALVITVTDELSHVIFFPEEGHPGFRCLGGSGLNQHGSTAFVFDGCDPGTGEEEPNKFVVPFQTASLIGAEFFRTKQMSHAVSWFEL